MKQYRNSQCKQCGIAFKVINGRGKYCTLGCYHKSLKTLDGYKSRLNKICKGCGSGFVSNSKSRVQIKLNTYCSSICRRKNQSILQKTGLYKVCLNCNNQFYTKLCNSAYKFCSRKCGYAYRKGKYNPNLSISRAKLIASGVVNPKRNYYKQGWYTKVDGSKEWFGSSYEERRMVQLDKIGVKWTKVHGIRIPYIDPLGKTRNYVPDFLIDNIIVEEVKPSNLVNSTVDNNNLKYDAAIEFCKVNGYQYRIITEKEL